MSHSNWPRFLLFNLAYKQCNGIVKGWLHCLLESIGRFLTNSILMFRNHHHDVWSWTSRTLTAPHPLRPITSHFCLTPPPPLPLAPFHPPQSGRHMCIIPYNLNSCKRFIKLISLSSIHLKRACDVAIFI